MRMLTEKVIRKIWGRCIGGADSYLSQYNFYISKEQHEGVMQSLISQKNTFLACLPEGAALSKEQISKIEESIYKSLKDQAQKQVKEYALPNMHARLKALEKMIEQIEQLKQKVQQGSFRFKKNDMYGWSGADVLVTADASIDPKESHDKIVLISNPRPLTRLMESLRDICKPYLSYANKYAFYGRIANIANHYVTKNGDPGDDQKEMLALILKDVTKNITKDIKLFKTEIDQLVKDALGQ